MENTDENDWRELVKAFSHIGFDLDACAEKWWNINRPNTQYDKSEPFVSYERQNTETVHDDPLAGFLKYPYLCKYRDYFHSTMSKDFTGTKEIISYRELKANYEPCPKLELGF